VGEIGWQLLKTAVMLGIVLALVWWSIRFVGGRTGLHGRGRLLRVIEAVPLGKDRSILLVQTGGRIYLVGATGEQICLLDQIEDPALAGLIAERDGEGLASATQPFTTLLAEAGQRVAFGRRRP
jgi:flagellar protein FliO/FliZ